MNKNIKKILPAFALWPDCISNASKAANADLSCVTTTLTQATASLLDFMVLLAFFYMLYGSFLYITSMGEDEKITKGKKAMTAALTGLALGLVTRLLIQVLAGFFKVTLTI